MHKRIARLATVLAVTGAAGWLWAADGAGDASHPATSPAIEDSSVMATVNGKPIYMSSLIHPLVEAHGAKLGTILVMHEVVDQEARRRNIVVTDAEVRAEQDRMLKRIFGEDLTADTKQRLLDTLLEQRGLTRAIWNKTMRQNAQLRRIAEPNVTVSDSMLEIEFARRFGEKVQISHIALPSLQEAEKVGKLLKEGKDFAEMARKYSTNTATASRGGLLPAFARNDEGVPRAMREAAFALSSPGEVSGIVQSQGQFHLLKLHKRFAPTHVKLADVREELTRNLRERLVERAKVEILRRLSQSARIEYVNPAVRKAMAKTTP